MAFPARYTKIAVTLHWLIAALIITNVLLIWTVDSLPESLQRPVVDTHKSIGITVLGLAIMRWLWRASHRPPALPSSYPQWERIAAHIVHGCFYLLILALPLSGWMHDSAWKAAAEYPMKLYGLIPWPRIGWIMNLDPTLKEQLHKQFGALHASLAYVLYVLFTLHVVAALKHQFFDKEPELQRMWFRGRGKRA